jgi:uncharacterized SAM-binding protein YcdF (DUF218 family)
MSRNWYKTMTALLWLAPVVIGFRYWQDWDQPPRRMASHFDAAGRANGWMPRDVSLYFTLGVLIFVLTIFSFVLIMVVSKYSLGKMAWALLAFFHVEIWAVVYMLNSTLDYNLVRRPIAVAPLLIITPIGVLVILALAFSEKRGVALPEAALVAEEVHSGKTWSALFLAPFLAVMFTVLAVPNTVARLAAGLFEMILLCAFALAWNGFHYYFTSHGIEIRTLGFRLKSIPLVQIKQYEIGGWSHG